MRRSVQADARDAIGENTKNVAWKDEDICMGLPKRRVELMQSLMLIQHALLVGPVIFAIAWHNVGLL